MTLTIERAPTPNYWKGRRGYKPEAFVEHVTEGSAASALSWFGSAKSQVSAHYMVSREGVIYQFVDDENTAWHAGRVQEPTWPLLKPGVNPNLYTIGVEHEGRTTDQWTPAQLDASAELHINRAEANGIPLERVRLVEHNDIFSGKSCPGRLNIDLLFKTIQVKLAARRIPQPGDRKWSNYFGEYVILTRYISDKQWYFVRESDLANLPGLRAETPWSAMPNDG